MSINQCRLLPVKHKTKYVFLDCETTGLKPSSNELLSLSIISDNGTVLFDSLFRPVRKQKWKDAEAVNGISPEMVQNAPTYESKVEEIRTILKGCHIVMYNAKFDTGFLRAVLPAKCTIHCCMLAYANLRKELDYGSGDYHWFTLTQAHWDLFNEEFNAHSSLDDAQATRRVWKEIMEDYHFWSGYQLRKEFGYVGMVEKAKIQLRTYGVLFVIVMMIIIAICLYAYFSFPGR